MKRRWRGLVTLVAAFIFSAVAARAADCPTATEGYIVRLDTGPQLLSAAPPELLELKTVFAPAGIYRTDEVRVVEALKEVGLLRSVEPNYVVTLEDTPDDAWLERQWAMAPLGMQYCWDHALAGADVRIGVVDSGLFTEHEDLVGTRLLPGTNYCVGPDSPLRGSVDDSHGHGTFISGLIAAATGNGVGIAGIAPEAELVPLKCFSGRNGTIADIVAAIYGGVDDYGCQVLNLSFGLEEESDTLREAIVHAEQAGVIMIAAAGNGTGQGRGEDPLLYPAAWPEVIGVGAVDETLQPANFSFRNASVWISAPGAGMWSLSQYDRSGYLSGSGTSYAAPAVTAAAALALSVRPDLTRTELMELLRQTAQDLGEPGYDYAYGHGLLDIGLLLATVREDLDGQIDALAARYAEQSLLLAAYDLHGKMRAVFQIRPEEQEPEKQIRMAWTDDACVWKLFVLDSTRLTPLRNVFQLRGQ